MVVTSSTFRYGRRQGGEEAARAASADASPPPTIRLSLLPPADVGLLAVADGSESIMSSVLISGTRGGLAAVGGGGGGGDATSFGDAGRDL